MSSGILRGRTMDYISLCIPNYDKKNQSFGRPKLLNNNFGNHRFFVQPNQGLIKVPKL